MENRKNWLVEKVTKHNRPVWPCPTCGLGTLEFKSNWATSKLSAETQKEHPAYLSQNRDENISHSGFLICSNVQCGENIAIIGESSYIRIYNPIHEIPEEVKYYKPRYFYPSLCLFPIPKSCPTEISEQIKLSFSHYFSDKSAAANALRTTLELILNNQKISRIIITPSRKRKNLTLHARIDIFGNTNPELKSFLFASKWIGNAGSHVGEISKNDLLDGYELIQHCIDELYEKPVRMKELSSKAKSINKRKKPFQGKKLI